MPFINKEHNFVYNGKYQKIAWLGVAGQIIINEKDKEILLVDPWTSYQKFAPFNEGRLEQFCKWLKSRVDKKYKLLGILISHEHSDHINDIGTILFRLSQLGVPNHKIPTVYADRDSLAMIKSIFQLHYMRFLADPPALGPEDLPFYELKLPGGTPIILNDTKQDEIKDEDDYEDYYPLLAGTRLNSLSLGSYYVRPYIWDHVNTLPLDWNETDINEASGSYQRTLAFMVRSNGDNKTTFIVGSGGEMSDEHTADRVQNQNPKLNVDLLIQAVPHEIPKSVATGIAHGILTAAIIGPVSMAIVAAYVDSKLGPVKLKNHYNSQLDNIVNYQNNNMIISDTIVATHFEDFIDELGLEVNDSAGDLRKTNHISRVKNYFDKLVDQNDMVYQNRFLIEYGIDIMDNSSPTVKIISLKRQSTTFDSGKRVDNYQLKFKWTYPKNIVTHPSSPYKYTVFIDGEALNGQENIALINDAGDIIVPIVIEDALTHDIKVIVEADGLESVSDNRSFHRPLPLFKVKSFCHSTSGTIGRRNPGYNPYGSINKKGSNEFIAPNFTSDDFKIIESLSWDSSDIDKMKKIVFSPEDFFIGANEQWKEKGKPYSGVTSDGSIICGIQWLLGGYLNNPIKCNVELNDFWSPALTCDLKIGRINRNDAHQPLSMIKDLQLTRDQLDESLDLVEYSKDEYKEKVEDVVFTEIVDSVGQKGSVRHSFFGAYLITIKTSDVVWNGIQSESLRDSLIPDVCDPYFHSIIASQIRIPSLRLRFLNNAEGFLERKLSFMKDEVEKIMNKASFKNKIVESGKRISSAISNDVNAPMELSKLKTWVGEKVVEDLSSSVVKILANSIAQSIII